MNVATTLQKWLRTGLNPLHDERGIGLAESIVAVGLLGVGVVAFITMLSTGSLAVKEQTQQTTVQQLAQSQLETIKAAPYDVTGASYPSISTPPDYSVAFVVDSTIYAGSAIQKITVTVSKSSEALLTLEGYKVFR